MVQEGFEATICSPHAREGRLLARWVELFNKQLRAGAAAPSPPVVLDFVQYLARLVVAQHSLQSRLQQVHVCTARLLLSMLQPTLWMVITERNEARDVRMLAQQRWMRALPPSQLGVEARFINARSATGSKQPPPLTAVSVLADFCFLSVPVDMLLCLYRAVGLVHQAAAEAANVAPSVIGADSLLPLLVWTVAHTPLPHIFSALEFAKMLSTREQITSELGYYLACLEAACEYVLDARPGGQGEGSDVEPGPTLPTDGSGDVQPQPLMAWSDPAPSSDAQRATTAATRASEVAGREALVSFLQAERAVDDLVEALVL